jgi:electron transfer flavoprotein alpha/beta subunit
MPHLKKNQRRMNVIKRQVNTPSQNAMPNKKEATIYSPTSIKHMRTQPKRKPKQKQRIGKKT